ncbi:hypothetical protein ARMGADRAFT_1090325 [Armillaria gallica]|uniref:Uncharacterized protein n=1 Tax=Armillaria gallica TaxID=47427 RepID=A0A2H3CHD8_ARMGA|nr:hypothetical protein ARMGADRAFT_1090325 [Armillaria gallica]
MPLPPQPGEGVDDLASITQKMSALPDMLQTNKPIMIALDWFERQVVPYQQEHVANQCVWTCLLTDDFEIDFPDLVAGERHTNVVQPEGPAYTPAQHAHLCKNAVFYHKAEEAGPAALSAFLEKFYAKWFLLNPESNTLTGLDLEAA